MTKIRNSLILLDLWEHCNSNIEEQAKVKICNFLSKIKTLNYWRIFYYNTDKQTDKKILPHLEECNALLTNDPFLIYENLIENKEWFYFAGFHTNMCLLYNHIGIEALHKIGDSRFHTSYNVIEDCTVALDEQHNPISPRLVSDERIKNHLIHSELIIV